MSSNKDNQDLFIRIRAEWVLLTEDDIKEGVKRRETLLERLQHRHNLGLDDAHAQLHAFEKKNPELLFENS
jgi:hypothetical protein